MNWLVTIDKVRDKTERVVDWSQVENEREKETKY